MRLKSTIFATISVLLGFIGALVLVLIFEFFARAFGLSEKHWAWNDSEPPKFAMSLPDRPTHLKTHFVSSVQFDPVSEAKDPHRVYSYSDGYRVMDSEIGLRPAANMKTFATLTTSAGKKIYSVVYEVDGSQRRFTPGQDDPSRAIPFLVFGCSFAYGEGLNNDQTIPATIAKANTHLRVFNYGFHAWGPANSLRVIESNSFARDVPKSKGRAIFIYIDHHLQRTLGSLSLHRGNHRWFETLPFYSLDSSGSLVSHKMFSDGRPWLSWLYDSLASSVLLSYLEFDLPMGPNPDQFDLLAQIFLQMKNRLAEKLNINDFAVAIYPGSETAAGLVGALDKVGVNSLDYSKLNLRQAIQVSPTIEEDVHPSAAAADYFGRQLAVDFAGD